MIRLIFFFITIVILWDFFKDPIDLYYFRNPMRIFIAFENFFMDLLYYQPTYDTYKFKILRNNLKKIQEEFKKVSETLPKKFSHEDDPWFDDNPHYYFYDTHDFPYTQSLIDTIEGVTDTRFAVMDNDYELVPHRSEGNHLQYNLTIEEDPSSFLEIHNGQKFYYTHGMEVLYNHGRKHSVKKIGPTKRTVLILSLDKKQEIKII